MLWYPDFKAEFDWLMQLPGLEMHVPPHFVELPDLRAIFARLSQHALFSRFRWIITSAHHDKPEQLTTPLDQQTVMIYLSNEDFRLPWYTSRLAALFTPYCWSEAPLASLHAIPLGCLGNVPEQPCVSLSERCIDVFFSGQMLPARERFAQELAQVLKYFKPQTAAVMSVWTGRFRSGLTAPDYARYLAQARVALIPRGNSLVTYRLFEAMRAGCILVCEAQRPAWFLQHCPQIVMPPDWNHLLEVLRELWERPELMQEMHQQTRACYDHYCRPEAVADYILKELSPL
jgi:hypothetical protein